MPALLLAMALAAAQSQPCEPGAVRLVAEATERVDTFDLPAAAEALEQALSDGCEQARVPSLYVRGLVDARVAAVEGGSAAALVPVFEATAALGAVSQGLPGPAEIARLVLLAAVAAAEDERETMAIFLQAAADMAALQRAAGQPGAPSVSAFEAAGDLWYQMQGYEDAREAFTRGAVVVGRTPRVVAGLVRTAIRLGDGAAACLEIRALLTFWGDRAGAPPAVAEARAYLRQPGCR